MATIRKKGPYQWHVQIRRKGHPPQTKTFETRSAAEAWARSIETEIDTGRFIAAGRKEAESTTLFDALDRYEREVTAHKKSAVSERSRIKRWKAHPLSRKVLAILRGADFAAYRDQRTAAGIAASSVQKELVLIQHLFKTAKREWGMEGLQNPLEAVRKPTPDNARSRLFMADEERRLLAALTPQLRTAGGTFAEGGTGNPWIAPLVQLACETAMRRGELLALNWLHIDLDAAIAHLPETKNGTARTVPLTPVAVTLLRKLKPADTIDGLVFNTTANAVNLGFPRAVKRARREYEKECAENGITPDPRMLVDLHFHDLRHVATTRLAKLVPNVVELAAITGHKDLRMLQRYYHPDARDLAQRLAAQLTPSPNQQTVNV